MIVGDVAEFAAPDGTWDCFGCGFYKDSAPTELDDAVFAQTALANFPRTGYSHAMKRNSFFSRLDYSPILRCAVRLCTWRWIRDTRT
jgi:hypothetical protein